MEGARNTYILYNVHIRTINTYCILIHIIYSYNIICKLKSMLVKISMYCKTILSKFDRNIRSLHEVAKRPYKSHETSFSSFIHIIHRDSNP